MKLTVRVSDVDQVTVERGCGSRGDATATG